MHTPHHRNASHPKRLLRALGSLAVLLAAGSFGGEGIQADDDAPATNAAGDTNPAEPRPAAEYLPEAVKRIRSAGTVDTDIVQTIHFGSRTTEANGHYTQGTGLKLRLEFEIAIGRVKGRLLQVCDGEDLWSQQTIGDEVRVTLRKVNEIVAAARRGRLTTERVMMAELGLGGLAGMLASVDEVTTFDEVEVEEVSGTRLHVVRGRWDKAFRDEFAKGPGLEPITPNVVEIAFDETSFPRRIRYLREEDNTLRRLVTLEFRNTTLGAKVDPSQFTFQTPDGVFPKDVTAEYVQRLLNPPGNPQAP